jgi:hypothetical protein
MSHDYSITARVGRTIGTWATTKSIALTLLAGSALIFCGIALHGVQSYGAFFFGAFKTIGTALVASGMFAWLTKTAQLTGAIREELESTIYSERHLRHRKDIKHLWVAATRALHSDVFEPLDEKLYNAISANYLPTQTRFYYRAAKRVLTLELVDRERRIVKVVSCFEAHIVPDGLNQQMTRPVSLRQVSRPAGHSAPTASFKILNARTRAVLLTEEYVAQEPLEFAAEIKFEGSEEVICSDKTVYYQSLNDDNWLFLQNATFTDGMSVAIHFDPAELVVQYRPVGNLAFYPDGPQVDNCVTCATSDLIFAKMGIMITMQVANGG